MAWKKLEECMAEVEHFKKRVNQLLDFIEETGLRDKFEKWANTNIDYPDELTKRRLEKFKEGERDYGRKSRMFHLGGSKPIKTWNPVGGCKHHCYGDGCWAAHQAPRIPRYNDGFDHPKLFEHELKKRFHGDVVVFVASMGDLFGEWVPDEWIFKVIEAMKKSDPKVTFFLETKNPARYAKFLYLLPPNTIISTTIETNRDYRVSKAPPVRDRFEAFRKLTWPHKHVSIEPIMDFDLDVLLEWVHRIALMEAEWRGGTFMVSVGYDNWNCNLLEPQLEKTIHLIRQLEQFTKVERKTLRPRKLKQLAGSRAK